MQHSDSTIKWRTSYIVKRGGFQTPLPEHVQDPEPGLWDPAIIQVCRDQSSIYIWDF